MLVLYVTDPWPLFYTKGMKSWEIRSYPIDYRGDIIIADSKTNKAICIASLKNCISLTKELWEMNFEKHRTSCSYENLPYRKNGNAYAWILSDILTFTEDVVISRPNRKPYFYLDKFDINQYKTTTPRFQAERIACKFINNVMLLYWMKKNYFALIAMIDLASGDTKFITDEIDAADYDFVLNQINAN